ncbi:MAG: glutaredoxin family protein [Chloroflexi bacterium]|nr:glutaredoxin family protein [Chloroflexota bacterium]
MLEKAIVYTQPGCPYCRAAMDDLRRRGVPFEEKDVTTDDAALVEMLRLSGGEAVVPVIVQGGEVTVGFGGG